MSGDCSVQIFKKKNTDFMRGIAAILVVLSHYAEWWSWFTPSEGNVETFRIAMTRVGDYAVAIFLLLSGYALVKSLKDKPVSWGFIGRRIRNVYLPYVIVMGIIELLSGGFVSVEDFLLFASGYDHWYMFILFVFYIGFFLIWKIFKARWIRVALMAVFAASFSWALYMAGTQDFWYTANVVFVLGVLIGEYEAGMKKLVDKASIAGIILLSLAMVLVIRSGLWPSGRLVTEPAQLWAKIGGIFIWTLLIVFVTARMRVYDPVIPLLGKASLYIYLTHNFIFMWVVNNVKNSYTILFLMAAAATIAVSLLFYLILSKGMNFLINRMFPERNI